MAISTNQITAIISETFQEPEAFASIIKLLAGVGARLKLEVQRDAAQRAVSELHQEQQSVSQTKQAELAQEIAELNQAITAKQQEAAALQEQINAINAQLPELLK